MAYYDRTRLVNMAFLILHKITFPMIYSMLYPFFDTDMAPISWTS